VTFPIVDAKAVLHGPLLTVRSRVVAQARALPPDCGFQCVLDCTCQTRELVLVEHACRAKRVDLRPPQRFVDVDVPEPGHRSLIEERSLDRCAPAFELLTKPSRRERSLERLDPESLFEVGLELTGLEQLPGTEPAHVAVRNIRTVVQSDNSASMRVVTKLALRRVAQTSRHPEVNQKSSPRLEPNDQILATTFDR
jgi:hypothetical protein